MADCGLPDVISGDAAISACEKGPQVRQALCVFLAVKHRTAELPDVFSYYVAISAW